MANINSIKLNIKILKLAFACFVFLDSNVGKFLMDENIDIANKEQKHLFFFSFLLFNESLNHEMI